MQNNEAKIVGIVLSGGKSKRMGQEKGLVKYKGKALIEYAIDTLKLLCHELVISTANDDYAYLDLQMIADKIPDCGPIGGISTCMKSVEADIYLVISCDTPHIPTALFVDLLNQLKGNAIIPIDESGRQQPLVAAYASSASNYFHQALQSRNLKMMNLISSLETQFFILSSDLDYYSANTFTNFNRMEDISDIKV